MYLSSNRNAPNSTTSVLSAPGAAKNWQNPKVALTK